MKRFIFYHAGRILRAVGFNSREGEDPRVREMQQRVRDLGGIQFQFELHPDGSWTAESVNIEGIMTGSRDPRSPFAESMLVEETPNDDWLDDELDAAFVEQPKASGRALVSDLDDLAGSRDNLAKLNMALAYIEQGSLDSACSILNEVIDSGDEVQKQRARQLLAKIA